MKHVPASLPCLRGEMARVDFVVFTFFHFALIVTFLSFPHHVEFVIKGKELSISK
jgi:hypothetical protein